MGRRGSDWMIARGREASMQLTVLERALYPPPEPLGTGLKEAYGQQDEVRED